MAAFPGDMHIGWGFGRELPVEQRVPDYREPCYVCGSLVKYVEAGDGVIVVPHCLSCRRVVCSQHINADGYCSSPRCHGDEPHLTDPLLAVSELEQRITDLEERLRSLTIVVNSLVARPEQHTSTDIVYAGDAEQAEYQHFMEQEKE